MTNDKNINMANPYKLYHPDVEIIPDGLSFSIAHSMEAHQPLGSIMRARLRAYPEMSSARRQGNNLPIREPLSIDEVPA